MQGQRVDKLSAGKPEGESGAGPPENACIDSNSFNIDTLNYIQSAKARIWTFALAELVALFSTVLVFAWWRIPNLFGAMTASLESIRFISDIVIACVILTVFSILPIFWLRVFWRREKSVRAAALRWIEDGRIMEFQRCIIRELLATISPEIRRSIIDRQGGDSETKEINLLLYLVKAGNSSLEKEPIFEENAKRIRALLSSVPQLTSLFHAHLGTTVGVTETAAFAIMRQLGEVKVAAESLVGKLGSSNAKAQAMENTVQEEIVESHDLIASINAYHRERTRQVKEDVAGIESIALQIEELKSMTGMIRDITSQTNVLAINAAIEAARAGQAGRGFTIVASEVRKLSRQIEDVTLKIEDSIGKVSSTTKTKLSSIVAQTRIEVEEKQLASMDSALPRLSGYYMDAVLELEELSRRTQDSVQLIRGSVMDILAHAQFQDITRQQIEQVQKGILILGERMKELGEIMERDLSQPLDIKPFQEIADSMKSNYTMMVQRKIHHKTLGGALPEAEEKQPNIELF